EQEIRAARDQGAERRRSVRGAGNRAPSSPQRGSAEVERSGGAPRKLCQQGRHVKSQHDRFHKAGAKTAGLPAYGNWNLSFFAFLLVGETVGAQETSKEGTYGASIEGWIALLYSEEEDDLIREILDAVLQGLDLVMALFEDTPSQLHDSVHWKTNEPDFDRCMRHFYPRGRYVRGTSRSRRQVFVFIPVKHIFFL
ncbi:unnamed protein product, partial [Symbiodinium microadriaticum]